VNAIGVDFGSTALRIAGRDAGGRLELLPGSVDGWPGILFEPRPEDPLGIAFPSLKSELGNADAVAFGGRRQKPEELVTAAFRALRGKAEERWGSAGEVVVAVPALYTAAQRAALRQAVLAAGFSEAHLLTDSVAAVLALHGDPREGVTALVYGVGYAGVEVGLIRLARGRCHALGYEGGPSPAGRDLDRLLLAAWLGFLEERRLRLEVASWDAATWLALRARIEAVKEQLSSHPKATLPVVLDTPSGGAVSGFSVARSGFEAEIAPIYRSTLEHAEGLLAQAGLTPADLDRVLLVGGTTRIPALQRMLAERLGREPLVLAEGDLARGAALFAARLGGLPVAAESEPGRTVAEPHENGRLRRAGAALRRAISLETAPEKPMAGELLTLTLRGETGEASPASAPSSDPLAEATRLIEEGRAEEASHYLAGWIEKAQELLAKARDSAAESRESASRVLARRALARARRKLERGKREEAVRESHLAWEEDRDDPEVFEQMIELHCRAAETSTNHEDALRWLGCAHTHDQGNPKIRSLLADRYCRQARELHQQGQRARALELLEKGLAWDPEHPEALELEGALTRR
jgi:tetratricopeptide (TPR) repeat protein